MPARTYVRARDDELRARAEKMERRDQVTWNTKSNFVPFLSW
jgi:hypothetical protein